MNNGQVRKLYLQNRVFYTGYNHNGGGYVRGCLIDLEMPFWHMAHTRVDKLTYKHSYTNTFSIFRIYAREKKQVDLIFCIRLRTEGLYSLTYFFRRLSC